MIKINYYHKENSFNDFNREGLIPFMLSREGPAIAVSDINDDNILDVYLGSPSFQKSKLFLGENSGNYTYLPQG